MTTCIAPKLRNRTSLLTNTWAPTTSAVARCTAVWRAVPVSRSYGRRPLGDLPIHVDDPQVGRSRDRRPKVVRKPGRLCLERSVRILARSSSRAQARRNLRASAARDRLQVAFTWHVTSTRLSITLLTIREQGIEREPDDAIRVISARRATPHERKTYENEWAIGCVSARDARRDGLVQRPSQSLHTWQESSGSRCGPREGVS